jgi:hypothetical protein
MTTPSPVPAAKPPTLDDFFDAVRAVNPFLINRVDRPLDVQLVHVEAIHESAFNRIVALGGQAQRDNRGLGVTVWGEAGVGKSHLLARLGRWAQHGPRAAYVYLHNLQASPDRLPRYVLRSVLNVLTAAQRGPAADTPLFDLMNVVLKEALARENRTTGSWPRIEAAYRRLVDDLAGDDPSRGVLFDRTAYEVLFRFYRAAHARTHTHDEALAALAVRWLSGEPLEEVEAMRLGVRGTGGPVALADNQHVKQILVALTQVARVAKQLVLLCFDQIDNLEEGQVKALSRFLHDLLDSAGNLLIVTTGVRQTLLTFLQRGVITETSWDRLGQFEIVLGRLRREQGRALMQARLQRFLAPYAGLEGVAERLQTDALFPLGTPWFEARVRDLPDFRPRDLIGWACEQWQRQQEELTAVAGAEWLRRWSEERGPEPVSPEPTPPLVPRDLQDALDRAVRQRMADHKVRCLNQPSRLRMEEDHFLGLVESSLRQCQGVGRPYLLHEYRRHQARAGQRGAYDLTVEQRLPPDGRPLRIGVRVLLPDHANTANAALRRLVEDDARPQRVLLATLRDRLPLGQKGAELLEELTGRGRDAFRHVELSPEQYADLDALQAVVRQARSDDFEFEAAPGLRRTATEEEVLASHHRTGRYLAHPLLRELLGEAAPAAPAQAPPLPAPPAVVDERRVREFLAAEVALGRTALTELARRYAERQAAAGRLLDESTSRAELSAVALRMAHDGLLLATSADGDLVLAPAVREAHPAVP